MSDNQTRLLMIRHGESEATVKRIFGGEKSCTGLSDLGHRQAQALRDRWVAEGFEAEALCTSTMPRAIETADVLNEALGGLELHAYVDLVEHRPGDADGLPYADLQEQYGPIDWHGRPHRPFAPGAEGIQEFHYRTSRALEEVLEEHAGCTIVITCHGGVIDAAFRYFLDLPRRGHFDLFTLNTSITEFVVDDSGHPRGRWRLERYNDHAHLAGLPAETDRG